MKIKYFCLTNSITQDDIFVVYQTDANGENLISKPNDLVTAVSILEAENVQLKHDLAMAETTNSELSLVSVAIF